MYDKSPSLAELLAKEGLSCEKIVTGRIEYIKVKDFETQIKDAQWLVFTSKNAVAGFAPLIHRSPHGGVVQHRGRGVVVKD